MRSTGNLPSLFGFNWTTKLQPMKKLLTVIFAATLAPSILFAQFPSTDEVLKEKSKDTPEAQKPMEKTDGNSDVSSLENIVHALYDVISGPKDVQIDLERWHNLFAEGAILAPTFRNRQTGGHQMQIVTPTVFMDRFWNGGLRPQAFYEIETDRATDNFGAVTQIFSTYESRSNPADLKPFQRGINSIQIMNDGSRWWIVSVFWDSERADQPIPSRYGG